MPSRSAGSIAQDRKPVELSKHKPKSDDLKDPKPANQALRTGAMAETVKKHGAGSNKKTATSGPVVYPRNLDVIQKARTEQGGGGYPRTLEELTKTVKKLEVRTAIQTARLDKNMTQAELGKKIDKSAQVVEEYESGKAVPDQAVLKKMEEVLGVKLRGKMK